MSLLHQFGLDQSPEVQQLGVEFSESAEPFKGMETDYKQMQYFALETLFSQLRSYCHGFPIFSQQFLPLALSSKVGVHDSYHRIPLKSLLTKILEIPGILQVMLNWQRREGDAIQDVFDGEFCKTHPLFQNEVLMPLLIYQDDCEIVNPFGSKTRIHKLGLIYFLLKSLPPDLLSGLQSRILLVGYKSDDASANVRS